jgi:hypothetical protein
MGSNREVATGLWPVAGRAAGEANERRRRRRGSPFISTINSGVPTQGRFSFAEGAHGLEP